LQGFAYLYAQNAHPDPLVQAEMDDLLQHYFTYLLERGLNSPRFLREIQHPPTDMETEKFAPEGGQLFYFWCL
jgi:hypothetical protein